MFAPPRTRKKAKEKEQEKEEEKEKQIDDVKRRGKDEGKSGGDTAKHEVGNISSVQVTAATSSSYACFERVCYGFGWCQLFLRGTSETSTKLLRQGQVRS